jgi:hypothetical protein
MLNAWALLASHSYGELQHFEEYSAYRGLYQKDGTKKSSRRVDILQRKSYHFFTPKIFLCIVFGYKTEHNTITPSRKELIRNA